MNNTNVSINGKIIYRNIGNFRVEKNIIRWVNDFKGLVAKVKFDFCTKTISATSMLHIIWSNFII